MKYTVVVIQHVEASSPEAALDTTCRWFVGNAGPEAEVTSTEMFVEETIDRS